MLLLVVALFHLAEMWAIWDSLHVLWPPSPQLRCQFSWLEGEVFQETFISWSLKLKLSIYNLSFELMSEWMFNYLTINDFTQAAERQRLFFICLLVLAVK